jgi:tetratricopeptide (TPR) repeat protein
MRPESADIFQDVSMDRGAVMSIRSFPTLPNVVRDAKTAAFIAAAAGLLIAVPIGMHTQDVLSWCNDAMPDLSLQIKGCTALIRSGQWSEKYVAFAYNDRGSAYQAMGDYDRAIADYLEAVRLDPKYVFPHYDRSNEYRSADLKASVAP